MTENATDLATLENAILMHLQQAYAEEENMYYAEEGVIKYFSKSARSNQVRICLNNLTDKNFITQKNRLGINSEYIKGFTGDTHSVYMISSNGLQYVNDLAPEDEELAAAIHFADKPMRFRDFRDALIIALYHKSNEYGLDLYNLKDLADENHIAYRKGWIFEFCTFLDENGYGLVAKSMGGDEVQKAKLNANGLEYAEELTAQPEGEAHSDAPSLIPASDRYVEIDDNSPDFKDAKAKVESAAEAIRGYNEPTNYDKAQIVNELTIGQQLFKSVKVRVGAVVAMILTPLYTAYHDTAAATLRPVVEAAIDAVKVWLGL